MLSFYDVLKREMVIDKEETGHNIKQLIVSKYGSLKAFCRVTGFDYSTSKKWCKGKNIPQLKVLCGLSMILEVPVNNILKFKEMGELELELWKSIEDREVKSISGDYNDKCQEIICSFRGENFNFVSFADVILLMPLVHPKVFLSIADRVCDCDSPRYISSMLKKEVSRIADMPKGRYVIRLLKKRGCPLVDSIFLPEVKDSEIEDEEAYFRLRKKYFDHIRACTFEIDINRLEAKILKLEQNYFNHYKESK